jgi:hypothetical protein
MADKRLSLKDHVPLFQPELDKKLFAIFYERWSTSR